MKELKARRREAFRVAGGTLADIADRAQRLELLAQQIQKDVRTARNMLTLLDDLAYAMDLRATDIADMTMQELAEQLMGEKTRPVETPDPDAKEPF